MKTLFLVCPLLLLSAWSAYAQRTSTRNEQMAAAAQAERKVMQATYRQVLAQVKEEPERTALFEKAHEEWLQYTQEHAKADAVGVSGEARYPETYFESLRELIRYRTRILEGCLERLKAERIGIRGTGATNSSANTGQASSARDWKAEVGDEPSEVKAQLYEAQLEGADGIISGQWVSEALWRGLFLAERGDSVILYGGKMERGGIVFEAWQEGTRIGRGFMREEGNNFRGRFFDERRREWPAVMKLQKPPAPASYKVGETFYRGVRGVESLGLSLEWHHTRFVQGQVGGLNPLVGHNYSGGKLYLEERTEGQLIAIWSLHKKKVGGGTNRWIGQRQPIMGPLEKIDFGK